MEIIIDSRLMFDLMLSRLNPDNNSFSLSRRLVELIEAKEIDAGITMQCFNKIVDYRGIFYTEKAMEVARYLKRNFKIYNNHDSGYDYEAIRKCQNMERAIELVYVYKYGFDALVTENKNNYSEADYGHSISLVSHSNYQWKSWENYFWSLEEVLTRYELERVWGLKDQYFQPQKQKQLSLIEVENMEQYRIRNNCKTVLESFRILKDVGCHGMAKKDFMNKLRTSEKTTNSIIWDMEHLQLAYTYGKRITANKDLLDCGDNEISQYLHVILQDHVLYQKINQCLKSYNSLTQWRIEEIIKETYNSQKLKGKTLTDYRSRILSWFFFAKLLEKKIYDKGQTIITLPNNSIHEKVIKSDLQQLELNIEAYGGFL